MKRFAALSLVLVLVLSLCACGSKSAKEDVEIVGGYTQRSPEEAPSEEEAEVFAKAVEGTEYSDYELTATLGTQVVAGTNYRFLCKTASGAQKVLVVYRDLQNTCTVTSEEDYE